MQKERGVGVRILIIRSEGLKEQNFSEKLASELKKEGNHLVDVKNAKGTETTPLSGAAYQLIVLVSNFKGLWKPSLSAEMQDIARRMTRLQGKKGAAFVPSKLGQVRALRSLMALLEAQGVMVEDFGSFRGTLEVKELAKRLGRLG